VVDSFKTPDDINYTGNGSYNPISIHKDTVYLGQWVYNSSNYEARRIHTSVLVKYKGSWHFHVLKDNIAHPIPTAEAISVYQNLIVQDGHVLLFPNGSLELKSSVTTDPTHTGTYIFEYNNHIYLQDSQLGFTYLSFDAGISWYIYPRLLYKPDESMFININADEEISYFNKHALQKKIYKFLLREPVVLWESASHKVNRTISH
jgi:hypothetical protein